MTAEGHTATVPGRPETTIQLSVFEGLFVHVLEPTGAFAEELRRAGFDPARPQPSYPCSVFKACLEVACRHVLPHLPLEQAMCQLGRRLLEGYFETSAGKVLKLLIPVVGVEGVLRRLHPLFAMGAKGTDIEAYRTREREWRVLLRDLHPLIDFNAGTVHDALERTGVSPDVTIVERGATHGVLRVRW